MSFARGASPPQTLSAREQTTILKVTGQHVAGGRDHMIISTALGTALREIEIKHLAVGDVSHNGIIKARIELRHYKGMTRKPPAGLAAAPRKTVRQEVWLPRNVRIKLAKFIKWKKKRGESLAPTAPLFIAIARPQNGNVASAVSTRTLRHMWRQWQRRAGFEKIYPFHSLRHTSLSNLYRVTKDLRLVQAQARHASSDTTEIYTHISDEEMRRAIEDLPS